MDKLHARVTRHVYEAPKGPEIAAFFDFDRTLISGFSALPFIREQLQEGKLNPQQFIRLSSALANFSFKMAEFSDLLETSASIMEGVAEEEYLEFGESVFRKHLARIIYPESRALVNAHLEQGHTVVLVSSATPYQVAPAAEDLGFHHVLCSRFEVADGLFTGKVTEFCWGEGKVAAAEKLADQLGVDVDQSFAYSDGHEDIPLLDWVGNPRAVNPTAKLTATARRQKWPILRFSSRSRPRTSDLIRSLAATYSIIPSFASGIPVWALTGSKKEALNYSISLFAETASALIGLKLKIEGEHHLWETRPAVFVFNHQSKADVVIMAKLLRRDIASVGKKEIRNLPVIGQILELGGVVMIDRKNSASAIEAMKPLVDAIQEDGKSVCLAPEGTRSATNKLGAFKKGAFHLAMQAGVPVVPVVIHNAADSAPKGTFTFRPATVRVTVLPPVDTSGWKSETVDKHVASVRRMFLKALGQTDEPGRARKAAKGTSKPVAGAKKQTTARKTATSGKTSAGKKAPPKKRTAAATAARPKAKSSGATPSPKKKKSPAGGTKKRTGKRKASGSEAVSSRPQPPAKPQTPGIGDAQNGPGSPANREHDTPTGSESQGA